ncbi:cellulose biosynthesis cyclic di-GMP-binding regulatory protein BcsB [Brevibacillus composti]|uniref:Cellulose biosynthesis cyclic di-GMP-binding regulatory protein BcsB n=1 Tax=Brevibacillus composti TaxID=2796470 RepID=A0A7T5EJF6_9BACL|nr:cellulose biosynthesis cyclic di-GMP-binding regulatory protein BcsB [Brevibacillus composti]QQE73729.1 cellulose biosynthesis cyclic di-GMP-binding regulatory protein BcsB [Brevibacillus composti]QUO40812.1 cellulose biosynthesis cyclic di-GMP-binding regulatory protein BcsB [Brevibacillus composti]
MKRTWKRAVLSMGTAALMMGQYAPGLLAQTETVLRGSLPVSFQPVKENEPVRFSPNVAGTSPGYVYRFLPETVTLTGVDAAQDFYYKVPKAELGSNHYLELTIAHSDLLIPSQSTLTVSVDDKPLKSIFLTAETSKQTKLTIPLGRDETTEGFHKITISKHGLISDDLCNDQYNPANWVKVGASSLVFIDTKSSVQTKDLLNDFPYPFVEPGTDVEVYSVIVVPDSPSNDIITSALLLATSLSSYTATKRPLPIMTETEWEKAEGSSRQHALAVGKRSDWKGALRGAATTRPVDTNDKELAIAYASLAGKAEDRTKMMMLVTAEDDAVIRKNIDILTNPSLNRQLAGNRLAVNDGPAVEEQVKREKELTLSSFGYDHILLDEIERESSQLMLQVPSHWKLTGHSTLDLKVKVSPLLLSDLDAKESTKGKGAKGPQSQPALTVTVGGIPTTYPLDQLKAEDHHGDHYTIRVPLSAKQIKESGRGLDVKISAHIEPTSGACVRERNNGRWIFIDKESSLNVAHEYRSESSFRYWPAPFMAHDDFTDAAFLLPEKAGSEHLTQLSSLVNNIAMETRGRNDFRVFREPLGEQEKQQLNQYNVILIGSLDQFPSLASAQDKLLVQMQGGKLQSAVPNVINEMTEQIAWIQPSVWNAGKHMAIFTPVSHGDQGPPKLDVAKFLDFLKADHVNSHMLVMSKSGEVFSIPGESESDVPASEADEQAAPAIPLWVIFVMIGVFTVALLFFLELRRKEKRRNSAGKE